MKKEEREREKEREKAREAEMGPDSTAGQLPPRSILR